MRRRRGNPGQTPYLSEIADDQNRRVAMVVAKFGLEKWLNGDMVRTTLITEPHGSEHMRRVFGFFTEKTYREAYEAREEWAKDGMPYSYGRMLGEFRRCLDPSDAEFARTGFLYGRAFGDGSVVRDVWEETRGELGTASIKPFG